MRNALGMAAASVIVALQAVLTIGYQLALPIMWLRRDFRGPFELLLGRGFLSAFLEVVAWTVGQFVVMGIVLVVLERARQRCVDFARPSP